MQLRKVLRLQTARTDPFSFLLSMILVAIGAAFAVAVVIIYYRVSGFNDICTPTPSISYNNQSCAQASLLFGSQYFTRPSLAIDEKGNEANDTLTDIGSFPWTMGGFGDGTPNQDINYAQQSLNYTSAAFDCQLFYTYVTLRLETGSSTTQTCWYCGDKLRVTCSLVDSERTETTMASVQGFKTMLQNYDNVLNFVMDNARSIYDGGEILSVTLKNYTAVPGLPPSILGDPFNSTVAIMSIGTFSGGLPISAESSNANIRQLAASVEAAGYYASELARNDLNNRPFLVNYACQVCERKRKDIKPLVGVLVRDVGALWTPFWSALLLAAALIWGPEKILSASQNSQPPMQSAASPDPKLSWQSHNSYTGINTPTLPYQQPLLHTQQSYASP